LHIVPPHSAFLLIHDSHNPQTCNKRKIPLQRAIRNDSVRFGMSLSLATCPVHLQLTYCTILMTPGYLL